MGIALLSGREFTRADNETALPVAIVNDVMATQYWRGDDPIGKRLQVKGQWLQVVGVAKVSKYQSVRENPKPFFYVPLRQDFSIDARLNIRTRMPAEVMAGQLAREVHTLDANLAPYELITLREQVERSTSPQRVAVTLLGVLSGLALLLATIGLYAATYVGSSTYVDVLSSIHHLSLTTAPIRLTIDNNFRLPTPVEAAT